MATKMTIKLTHMELLTVSDTSRLGGFVKSDLTFLEGGNADESKIGILLDPVSAMVASDEALRFEGRTLNRCLIRSWIKAN